MYLKLAYEKVFSKKTLLKFLVLLVQASLCAFILCQDQIFPRRFNLGEKSSVTITSTKNLKIIDQAETKKAQEKYKQKVLREYFEDPSYIKDNSLNQESLNQLKNLLNSLDLFYLKNSASADLLSSGKIKNLKKNLKDKSLLLDSLSSLYLDQIEFKEWENLKNLIISLGEFILKQDFVGQVSSETIKSFISSNQELLEKEKNFRSLKISEKKLTFIKLILEETLSPNFKIKFKSFKELQAKTKENHLPVIYKKVPAKTVLVKKNEIITGEKIELVESLSLQNQKLDFEKFLGMLFLCTFFLFSFFIQAKLEKLYIDFRQIFLFCFLITGSSLLAFFLREYSNNLIPIASLAMFVSLFFKPSLGLSIAILFGGLCIYAFALDPVSLAPSIISSIVSVIVCQKAKNRAEIAQSGIYISVAAVVSYLLICIFFRPSDFFFRHLFLLGSSGFLMAFIVAGGMPYLESLFSLITRFKLLELSDFKQPLLQRLQEEAPGTFEHSLIVADLAQQAAKKLDLNHELVRAGVLYHDIGKLHNPKIFIENQFDRKNPHDHLSYQESAYEIIKHVTEGIKLAKKYKLPQAIIDFIPMHQGSARAGYFYEKSCQENPELRLKPELEKNFRYPGPIPQSPETGIVMLADTCEATIRSLKKVNNHQQVIDTISSMIQNRIKDGQLKDTKLSPTSLKIIEISFFESWKNKNHERITYKIS